GDAREAARLERARGGGGELRVEEAPLVVPLLRPGIGEEDEHARERSGREAEGDEGPGVDALEAYVRQASLQRAGPRDARVLGLELEAEVVAFRVRGGLGEEEAALARADLQLHGRRAAEEEREIEKPRAWLRARQ